MFGALCVAVLLLATLYCFRMWRQISVEEVGLYNPIYMYYSTGRVTYPMHQYPQDSPMYVHPPTHYLLSGEVMKLTGLRVFHATAFWVFLLTVVFILTLVTGRFSFPVAIAALLGFFMGIYIHSYFNTVRPEVHISAAWFTGIFLLQAASNSDWSTGRLFAGSLVCTYAGTMHYWATPAFLAVGVYGLYFLLTVERQRWAKGIAAMGTGALLVGLPYLLLFVIPEYDQIRAITSAVQGDRTWHDAWSRHLKEYDAWKHIVKWPSWPSFFLPRGLAEFAVHTRWLDDLIIRPLLELRFPAILMITPVLMLWRQTRAIGIAGFIVPAFVLFYSQGKGGDYYLPEFMLYMFAMLLGFILLIKFGVSRAALTIKKLRPNLVVANHLALAVPAFAVLLSLATLYEVPRAMGGYEWRFAREIDSMDVNRAAARQIVGLDSVTLATAVNNWYTAGGSVIWNAFVARGFDGELGDPNVSATRVADFLSPADYAVELVGVWWTVMLDGVPLNLWYQDGRLELQGFVFNRREEMGDLDQLFFGTTKRDGPPKGFYLEKDRVMRFVVGAGSEITVTFLICDAVPKAIPYGLDTAHSFPVYTRWGDPGDQMVILMGKSADVAAGEASLGLNCHTRDRWVGSYEHLDRSDLLRDFRKNERKIRFTDTRGATLAARAENIGKSPPGTPTIKAEVTGPGSTRVTWQLGFPPGTDLDLETDCGEGCWKFLATVKQAPFEESGRTGRACYRARARDSTTRLESSYSNWICLPLTP